MNRILLMLIAGILLLVCACQPPIPVESDQLEAVEGIALDTLILDTDLDGFFDQFEEDLGTDPTSPDTDDDGYTDRFEYYYFEFGFDPTVVSIDSDRDGLTDPFEEERGTSPQSVDSDRDGWSDFDEVFNAFFGFDPLKPTEDQDFDGLADPLEDELGTGIFVVDSDGDGASDFQEVAVGHNPLMFNERFGQEIGLTYSAAMQEALVSMRFGGEFPLELAEQLPYPEITANLAREFRLAPSAALLQQAVFNPSNSPGIYDCYNDVVIRLHKIATVYGAGGSPYLARLFVWSAPTIDMTQTGHRVYALKISDNPGQNEREPELLLMGAHHGNEMISVSTVMGLIERLVTVYPGDDEINRLVDTTEGWFIPVVNPNGYERSCSNYGEWRKNAREVSTAQFVEGVDLNRNYDFEHLTDFIITSRRSLGSREQETNGLNSDGSFNMDSTSYPGPQPFSEVETQAVMGLVDNQFRTGDEVDGIRCSISWHSYGGMVLHPMGHNPVAHAGLTPEERECFLVLSESFANASGYTNMRDTFPTAYYPTYGDSDDWLLKERRVYALTVEAYGYSEGNAVYPSGVFNPSTVARRDLVVDNNIKGAIALMKECPCAPD